MSELIFCFFSALRILGWILLYLWLNVYILWLIPCSNSYVDLTRSRQFSATSSFYFIVMSAAMLIVYLLKEGKSRANILFIEFSHNIIKYFLAISGVSDFFFVPYLHTQKHMPFILLARTCTYEFRKFFCYITKRMRREYQPFMFFTPMYIRCLFIYL